MQKLLRQKAGLNILPKLQGLLGVFCFVVTLTFNTQQSEAWNYVSPVQQAPAQINLFGASEEKFADLSAFTKWNGVLERFKGELIGSLDQKPVQDWLLFLDGLQGQSKENQINAVNAYMNKIRFISDANNYGQDDHWATPMEFLAKGGDCEDYSITKRNSSFVKPKARKEIYLAIE